MGLFDLFKKQKPQGQAEVPAFKKELAPISYAIAYFVLPRSAYGESDQLAAMWDDAASPAGARFYTTGCEFKGATLAPEHASLYRASRGELDAATEFYLLEYPEPPPVDFSKMFPGKNTPDVEVPVLAPYFSAVLRNRETGAVSYYVLGQSPVGGGTTLRSVARGGVNSNLGPGPSPRAEAFLDSLRAKSSPAA